MDNRVERVVLETDRHRIVGDLTLPKEGFRSRISDYLNSAELGFVSLVDVEVEALDGSGTTRRDFIAVGRAHVRLVYPAGDPSI